MTKDFTFAQAVYEAWQLGQEMMDRERPVNFADLRLAEKEIWGEVAKAAKSGGFSDSTVLLRILFSCHSCDPFFVFGCGWTQ